MRQIFDPVPPIDALHFWTSQGLDYTRLTDFLQLDKNDLSKLGGVSLTSVRLDDRMPLDLKDRLEHVANLCNLVAEYFDGDPHKTGLWFRAPNPLLGDVSPRDMIRFGRDQRLHRFVLEAREDNASSAT